LIFHGSRHPIICGRIDGDWRIEFAATLLTISGQLFSLWARTHLGKYWSGIITLKVGHRLIRTGPYRYLRHPLYTGFLSAILGSAIAAGTGDAIIGFAIAFASYLIKMQREESLLTREFGEEYRQFKRESAALVPHIY
jgi:protein-S-isoprenylcysteine O-methyltransferase Ste14